MREYVQETRQRYDADIKVRDGYYMTYKNVLYCEETWCVRLTEEDGTVRRFNKNGINILALTPIENPQ